MAFDRLPGREAMQVRRILQLLSPRLSNQIGRRRNVVARPPRLSNFARHCPELVQRICTSRVLGRRIGVHKAMTTNRPLAGGPRSPPPTER